MPKPTLDATRFAVTTGEVVSSTTSEPSGDLKDNGWDPGDRPPAHVINWLFAKLHAVAKYVLDGIFTGDAGQPGLTVTGGSGAGGKGVVITAGGTNENALEATGTGTGTGAVITGGATGRGITAAAGGGNNTGITSTGAGTGVGGAFTGGATGGGATATAGGGNTNGITSTGAGSGAGVSGTGGASGTGVVGVGGATAGAGGTFSSGTGSGGVGVNGVGDGAGAGGVFTGGASGYGATLAHGTSATGGARTNAARLVNGDLDMSNVALPSSTTSLVNVLTNSAIPKVWGSIQITNAATFVPSVDAGINIASVSRQGANTLRVTFAGAMANANYAVSAHFIGAVLGVMLPVDAAGTGDGRTTGYVDLTAYDWAGAPVSLDNRAGLGGSTLKIFLSVLGNQ